MSLCSAGSVVELEYYQPHAPEVAGSPTLHVVTVLQVRVPFVH